MKIDRLLTTILLSGIFAFFIVGCGDSKIEHENISLKTKVTKLLDENNYLRKQIITLKDKNKLLNVSLAKSEVDFTKRHKEELAKEQREFTQQREKMEKNFKDQEEKLLLQKEKMIKEIEQIISIKYITILSALLVLLIAIIILWILNTKKFKRILKEKEENISEITDKEDNLKLKINELQNKIIELEYKDKSGSKNQVVAKIEEYQIKRKNQMKDS